MESWVSLTLYATGEGVRDNELQKFSTKLHAVSDCSFSFPKKYLYFRNIFDLFLSRRAVVEAYRVEGPTWIEPLKP